MVISESTPFRLLVGFLVALAVLVGLVWVVSSNGGTTYEESLEGVGTESQPLPTSTPVVAPTATPTPLPTPTPTPSTVTMSFSGDVLSHGSVIRQSEANGLNHPTRTHDYVPMFAPIAERIAAADLAICHLETPVSSDNVALSGYPIFNAPRDLPASLADVGFDGCSTASNHSIDRWPEGIVSTLNQMDAAGLGHAGMSRSAEEQNTPTLYEVNGITIGHLSFTYGLNGFVLPADQPYLVNVTTVDAVLAQAAQARQAGADVVVLSIQWGNEYAIDPTPVQLEQAAAFTASPDIDMIIGAHAHIIQPIDTVNGKLVVYGLGNFLSNQSAECCPEVSQNGIIVEVDVTGSDSAGYAVSEVRVIPTRVDRSNYTIVALPDALADPNLSPGVRDIYTAAVANTTEQITRLGTDAIVEGN